MKLLTLLTAVAFSFGMVNAQEKQLDTSASSIVWNGKKVTGEHTGTISFKSGSLQFKGDKLKGGEFEVDMNSITCTDIEDEGYNKKLVNHLKSDDFFGVTTYPSSKLVLTSVSKNGKGYSIKGDLTIKQKTNPVEFMAQVDGKNFKGKMVIDRSKFDVRYGSGSFFDNLGDKTIYDDFTLEFSVKVK